MFEKIYFFISNVGYLLKTDFSIKKKIVILLKSIFFIFFGHIYNNVGIKHAYFDGLKISGLTYETIVGLFFEIFLKNEYKFQSINNKPIILDIGANIGIATIYFKWLYPESKIISFEPDKKHFEILKRNIQNNNFSDIEYYEKAVTNYTGEIIFYTENGPSFTMSTKKGRKSEIETKVKCISITEVIQHKSIDLLKMDIEGGEFDVLNELDKTGKIKQIKEMIIEYHHNIKDDKMSFSEFLDILEKNGFTYGLNTSLFPAGAKYKFQDILIHAYR